MLELSLEQLAYQRLKQAGRPEVRNGMIRFPLYFSKVCSTFCITKGQAWDLARVMEEKGLLEIVPFHGVRLNRILEN